MQELAIGITARPASDDEANVLAALRAGDEAAFARLVDAHHTALVRLASQYVEHSVAEEVVQEAWLGFLQSLPRFEGRSSLKTWLFRTLLNCARNRKRKEVRSVPFCAVFHSDSEREEPAVDQARFRTDGVWAGHWSVVPKSFGQDGERRLLQGELRVQLQSAIAALPPAQREVIMLRDVDGLSGPEVCEVLGVSEVNQRVLLHRARSRLRAMVEAHFDPSSITAPKGSAS